MCRPSRTMSFDGYWHAWNRTVNVMHIWNQQWRKISIVSALVVGVCAIELQQQNLEHFIKFQMSLQCILHLWTLHLQLHFHSECALCTLHFTLYTLHFELYTWHFTLYILHVTLPPSIFAIWTLSFALWAFHFTLCTLLFTLSTWISLRFWKRM